MGLFSKNIKLPSEPGTLYAITDGEVIGIDHVADEMFSQKMLGDGIAFKSLDGIVIAPCHGVVTTLFPTNHAIGITTSDGAEILIHIGIDTVKENGNGFKAFVKQGDKIARGQKLITFDIEKLENKGYDLSIPMVLTNMDAISNIEVLVEGEVIVGKEVITYSI